MSDGPSFYQNRQDGTWTIRVSLTSPLTVDDLAKQLGMRGSHVLDDIAGLGVNHPVRLAMIEQNNLRRIALDSIAGRIFQNTSHCRMCGRPWQGTQSGVCPVCSYNFAHDVETVWDRRLDDWSSERIFRHAVDAAADATGAWLVSGQDQEPAVFLRPRHHTQVLQSQLREKKRIHLRRVGFQKMKEELLKLLLAYEKERRRGNAKAKGFLQEHAREFREARFVDLWMVPEADRNRDLFDRLPEDRRKTLVKEAKGLLARPEFDKKSAGITWQSIRRDAAKLSRTGEPEAQKVVDYLRREGAELAKHGTEEDCVELAERLSVELFASDAFAEYYAEDIDPVLEGRESHPFWDKVWPTFPTQKEYEQAQEERESGNPFEVSWSDSGPARSAKTYFKLFRGGMKVFKGLVVPMSKITQQVSGDHHAHLQGVLSGRTPPARPRLAWKPLDDLSEKFRRTLQHLLTDRYQVRYRLNVTDAPNRPRQIVLDGEWQTYRSPLPNKTGRSVLRAAKVADVMDSVLTPINVLLAFYDLYRNPDDTLRWITMMGAMAGAADVTARVSIVKNALGLSDDVAKGFSRLTGFVGGATTAYVGFRDFQTDMDLLEADMGVCDLLIVAGGLFGAAGAFTGGLLTIIGAILLLIGGIGKWLFADTAHEQYLKSTRYYSEWPAWHAKKGYVVLDDEWRAITPPGLTGQQLTDHDFDFNLRYELEVAGMHDSTVYLKLFHDRRGGRLLEESVWDGYIPLHLNDGAGFVGIPGPLVTPHREVRLVVGVYWRTLKGVMKRFHTSEAYYRPVPASGRLPASMAIGAR